MFWIIEEVEGLCYYWEECETIAEAFDKAKTIKEKYSDVFPLIVRAGAVEIEESDEWNLRDFCQS